MRRTWGGVIAGALFVLPSLFILIALSWMYIAEADVVERFALQTSACTTSIPNR
jgi:chromate transport protein ChrA